MINDRHLKLKKNHQVENVFPQSNFISSTFTPLQALLVGGKMPVDIEQSLTQSLLTSIY